MHADTASSGTTRASRGARDARSTVAEDAFAVVLFEDEAGRLVVVDAQARSGRTDALGPLLRIGRARVMLRHLGAPVTARLLSEGHVVVDGADGLNVLLAFAHELGTTRA